MNPGLVVKLRPDGPWRIGPDSGARNRVDVIYHSDSLYSAVTSAMLRLGWLEEWLDATARTGESAVRFSSCFPFQGDLGYVVPPRTLWPPVARGQGGRVRWKSARFVPLGIVQALLAGQVPEENQWAVDGTSECLVPAGQPGPFRVSVRSNAAVDRVTGSSERHSSACIEFREGAGLWTIVSFADDAAWERWGDHVKTAFRVLADTGFGGKRSRGWGHSAAPEFVEGALPNMILPAGPAVEAPPEGEAGCPAEESVTPPAAKAELRAPGAIEPLTVTESSTPAEPLTAGESPTTTEPLPPAGPQTLAEPQTIIEPLTSGEPPTTTEPLTPAGPQTLAEPQTITEPLNAGEPQTTTESLTPTGPQTLAEPQTITEPLTSGEPQTFTEPLTLTESDTLTEPRPPGSGADSTAETAQPQVEQPPAPVPQPPGAPRPQWLLGLFAPSLADTVDWSIGNYTVMTRGGRIESPAASGDLKKHLNMVTEGSVLYASSELRGGAPDVAPDGFPHPVFRAGFAVAIPLDGGAV